MNRSQGQGNSRGPFRRQHQNFTSDSDSVRSALALGYHFETELHDYLLEALRIIKYEGTCQFSNR